MARLHRFSTTEIAMFFADHNPPHFHVLGREGAAQIRIDTLEVIASSGRIELSEALAWAAENRAFLEEKWAEYSGDSNGYRQDRKCRHGWSLADCFCVG